VEPEADEGYAEKNDGTIYVGVLENEDAVDKVVLEKCGQVAEVSTLLKVELICFRAFQIKQVPSLLQAHVFDVQLQTLPLRHYFPALPVRVNSFTPVEEHNQVALCHQVAEDFNELNEDQDYSQDA